MHKKILIIGGGISGIYLGYLLKKEGFSIKILEANDRIGGRIYTKNVHQAKIELGATWLWKYNATLLQLCKDLGISLFEQNMQGDALFEAKIGNLPQRFQLPKNQEISYRIVGGTATILHKLANCFSENELEINQKVLEIIDNEESIQVITNNSAFKADVVISTIPPQLLVNTIQFKTPLNENLVEIANKTHTWMKDSIKFAVVYKSPFWKEKGLSGVGFSNVGPFTEMYDHSDFENKHFALLGFLNGNLWNETKEYREEKIKEQLTIFFGDDGKNYLSYQEKVWKQENLLNFDNNQFLSPHENNGHAMYQQEFLGGKLIVAGSETSPSYGGYMEGAIYRGNQIAKQLKNKFL
ncbi:FAD-dependent oxidoreductase [Polaribacter litorisediminis]|uniref:flavin monoamine oxidase family protein n=1 Tax=Polaribacter litorisediminis TaxID=1908341 RepID=UPI001CC16C93|nr:FAD-dependent oxidoreductase [Polaribacter litorisediminis]UAM96686.1 FAD-dependent oxidoreductase [Polaribacter litorisediminis]